MLLECRHAAEHPIVQERRKLPLNRFVHVGTDFMYEFPEMFEDGFRKFSRLGDVGINARILFGMTGCAT